MENSVKAFTYNGIKITPYKTLSGTNFNLSYGLVGETKFRDGYNYDDFYNECKKNGCGKYDLFLLDDIDTVFIPANNGFFVFDEKEFNHNRWRKAYE